MRSSSFRSWNQPLVRPEAAGRLSPRCVPPASAFLTHLSSLSILPELGRDSNFRIANPSQLPLGRREGISGPNATVKPAILEVLTDNLVEPIVFCIGPQVGIKPRQLICGRTAQSCSEHCRVEFQCTPAAGSHSKWPCGRQLLLNLVVEG